MKAHMRHMQACTVFLPPPSQSAAPELHLCPAKGLAMPVVVMLAWKIGTLAGCENAFCLQASLGGVWVCDKYPMQAGFLGACVSAHQPVSHVQEPNQILAHVANTDLNLEHYAFSSQYVAEQIIQRAGKQAETLLLQMLDSLAPWSYTEGLRAQLFELYLLRYFLPTGGTVTVAGFDPGEHRLLASG